MRITTCPMSLSFEHEAPGVVGTDEVVIEPPPQPCRPRLASSAAVAPIPSLSKSRRLSLRMFYLDAAESNGVGGSVHTSIGPSARQTKMRRSDSSKL